MPFIADRKNQARSLTVRIAGGRVFHDHPDLDPPNLGELVWDDLLVENSPFSWFHPGRSVETSATEPEVSLRQEGFKLANEVRRWVNDDHLNYGFHKFPLSEPISRIPRPGQPAAVLVLPKCLPVN